MRSSLKIVVSFIEIFLLNLDLSYFVEGATLQELIIAHSDNLFKVQNSIIAIVKLLQCFSLVKVRLRECRVTLRRVLIVLDICQSITVSLFLRVSRFLLGKLAEFVKVIQCFLVKFHLQEEDASLHKALLDASRIYLNGFAVG